MRFGFQFSLSLRNIRALWQPHHPSVVERRKAAALALVRLVRTGRFHSQVVLAKYLGISQAEVSKRKGDAISFKFIDKQEWNRCLHRRGYT